MPNFSHGAAGIAYFLGALYQATNDEKFLETARKGAQYLISIADVKDNRFAVFHHQPDGDKLFYLGWCHGPAGTVRLFQKLHEVTGEADWMNYVERGARTIMSSGIPETRTDGFWNNCGVCCGSAGLTEFFIDLHQSTGKTEYLDFAKRLLADVCARADSNSEGLCWPLAEHRIRPAQITRQTGYMQGAAGIASCLLKFGVGGDESRRPINLPDNPCSR